MDWNPLLRARAGEPVLRNSAVSGGRSISGREQRLLGDAGFWSVPMRSIVVNTREKAAAYRAMTARLRQGESIILRICDAYVPRWARSEAAKAVLASAAPLRATQIGLTVTGIDVQPGHYLSFGDRLHLVTEIVSGPSEPPLVNPLVLDEPFHEPWTDNVGTPASYVVKILPPLRAALSAGAAASFSDLKLRAVPEDLNAGDLDLDLGRFGTPSITFIEDI